MENSILNSVFLLTLLLLVGLFFFIRASTKDRIEVLQLVSDQPQELVLEQVRQHFAERAYRVAAVDAAQQMVRWEGMVRPSWFLAIFLSGLAGVGSLCLALVLGMLLPAEANLFWGLVLVAPLAGVFYWRGAGRAESVVLQVKPALKAATGLNAEGAERVQELDQELETMVTVTAHRDELAVLKRSLPFAFLE